MPDKTIYYFPIDGKGAETSKPLPIKLKNGKVDLSALPTSLAKTLETFGAPDAMHRERIFPKDGERFLEALLRMTNGYLRFRSTAK